MQRWRLLLNINGTRSRKIQPSDLPACIHLAGADGSGKTTQARLLATFLEGRGVRTRMVWLRFPRLTSIPFLVYARLRGFSKRTKVAGNEHGIWSFEDSWILRNLFPWSLLVDLWLLSLVKVHLPILFGRTIVCDRYALDVLVDLIAGIKDMGFDTKFPGSLFFKVMPARSKTILLDLDVETALRRSPELMGDITQETRRQIYLEISRRRNYPVISSVAAISEVQEIIQENILKPDGQNQPGSKQAAAS